MLFLVFEIGACNMSCTVTEIWDTNKELCDRFKAHVPTKESILVFFKLDQSNGCVEKYLYLVKKNKGRRCLSLLLL